MSAPPLHLAQVNVARARAPLDGPELAGFVARIDEINALADGSPGFVWRLPSGTGEATYLRPYDDDRILFNLSVWRSVEELRAYVYRSAHAEVMRRRQEWFERFDGAYVALWWIPVGHTPPSTRPRRGWPTSIDMVRRRRPSPSRRSFDGRAHAAELREDFAPSGGPCG